MSSNANAAPPSGYGAGQYPAAPHYAQPAYPQQQQHAPASVIGGGGGGGGAYMYAVSDEAASDDVMKARESQTGEHTLRGLSRKTSMTFFALFFVAFIFAVSVVGNDHWFEAKADSETHYGLFKLCTGGSCRDHSDICRGMHPISSFCRSIQGAREDAVSALVSLVVGALLSFWSYTVAGRNTEARPLLRLILVGGSATSVATTMSEALRQALLTLADTEDSSGKFTMDVKGPVGAWVFGLIVAICAGVLTLVVWCGCGRARWCQRSRDCCYALRTPEHLLIRNVVLIQQQQPPV